MIKFIASAQFKKDATIIFVDQNQLRQKKFPFNHKKISQKILDLSKEGQFSGKINSVFPVAEGRRIILLVGVGDKKKTSLTALRIAGRRAILSSFIKTSQEVEVIPHSSDEPAMTAIIEGLLIGGYQWQKYKTRDKKDKGNQAKNIHLVAAHKKHCEDIASICEGVNLTRDLINDNADVVTSQYLEQTIRKLTKANKKISIETLNEKQLKSKGLNLHLAVNQGSHKEPKLIIVKYRGGAVKDPYTALIGKGITFDTGGLNLKPSGNIETMRFDMGGAGVVIGTLKNILAFSPKKNIIFAVGLAENAIDANSYKPGDVIRSYSGKTVEIGNTDAEGRLVLADAIAYVVKNYKPAKIIDIATLTGACIVALGYDYTGLMSNDDVLAKHLVKVSKETDDRVWRLPIYPEMKEYIKSNIADIRNLGLPKGALGTCTAAEFLRQFTGDTAWAHLDIAGTGFAEKERMYFGFGATGSGVRLLTQYLKTA